MRSLISRLRKYTVLQLILCQAGNGFMGGSGGGGGGGGTDGGNGGGGGGTGGGDGGSNGAGGGGDQVNYPADLDQSYHGNATLLKYYDKEKKTFKTGEVMKALIHASSMLGKDKLTLPDKNWTDEQWADLHRKLGAPETPDKYELKNSLPDGMKENAELMKGLKDTAHKLGILPKQLQGLLDFHNGFAIKAMKDQKDAAKAVLDKGIQDLKSEYGAAYERKMQAADRALGKFASEEEVAALANSGVLNNPLLTKIFVKLAEELGEDKPNDTNTKKGQMTVEEIEQEIKGYYAKDHAFSNPGHPKHQYYQDRFLMLQEKKLQARGVDNQQIFHAERN